MLTKVFHLRYGTKSPPFPHCKQTLLGTNHVHSHARRLKPWPVAAGSRVRFPSSINIAAKEHKCKKKIKEIGGWNAAVMLAPELFFFFFKMWRLTRLSLWLCKRLLNWLNSATMMACSPKYPSTCGGPCWWYLARSGRIENVRCIPGWERSSFHLQPFHRIRQCFPHVCKACHARKNNTDTMVLECKLLHRFVPSCRNFLKAWVGNVWRAGSRES